MASAGKPETGVLKISEDDALKFVKWAAWEKKDLRLGGLIERYQEWFDKPGYSKFVNKIIQEEPAARELFIAWKLLRS